MDERITELEEVMRRTSICGLGQVALGPVASVLRLASSGGSRDAKAEAGARSSSPPGPWRRRWPASAPRRRTPAEPVPVADALHRVPAVPVTAPHALPGFARSTVDGYAVRAADTYGVSEGLPGYLQVTGAVLMGAEPDVTVGPGTAVSMPTGGVLPPGADAVVMVEYTAAGHARHHRGGPAGRPGRGRRPCRRGRRPGGRARAAGRPLRAQDLAMLAAAGVTVVPVHARPRVTVFSTGDEVVPPEVATLRPGQVRDASAVALAAMVAQAGGEPVQGGIVADDPRPSRRRCAPRWRPAT